MYVVVPLLLLMLLLLLLRYNIPMYISLIIIMSHNGFLFDCLDLHYPTLTRGLSFTWPHWVTKQQNRKTTHQNRTSLCDENYSETVPYDYESYHRWNSIFLSLLATQLSTRLLPKCLFRSSGTMGKTMTSLFTLKHAISLIDSLQSQAWRPPKHSLDKITWSLLPLP